MHLNSSNECAVNNACLDTSFILGIVELSHSVMHMPSIADSTFSMKLASFKFFLPKSDIIFVKMLLTTSL